MNLKPPVGGGKSVLNVSQWLVPRIQLILSENVLIMFNNIKKRNITNSTFY